MHEGHRDRVKKRFRQEGLDHFSDIQALELLLFYGIPRVDTNPIAHALLDRFGSLSQVLEASPEELMKVPGALQTKIRYNIGEKYRNGASHEKRNSAHAPGTA